MRVSRDSPGSDTLVGTQSSPSVIGNIGDYCPDKIWESAVVGVMSDGVPVIMQINPNNGEIVMFRGNGASSGKSQDISLNGCLVYYRG